MSPTFRKANKTAAASKRFSGKMMKERNRLYFRCLHHRVEEACYNKVVALLKTVATGKDAVRGELET